MNTDCLFSTLPRVGLLQPCPNKRRWALRLGWFERDTEGMSTLASIGSTADMKARFAPLRARLAAHPLYAAVRTPAHLRLLMESHVYAVWDFMSLLKALQRALTCVEVPWVPSPLPASRRFLNEIVLGEESDEYNGRTASHFELYLEAMAQAGADTAPIRAVVDHARIGKLVLDGAPAAARHFVEATFRVIRGGSIAAQAAAFTFGREDAIPTMFRSLVRDLNREMGGDLGQFLWYLERHIEVDGDEHGPLALRMITDLCGTDAALWDEAAQAAEEALLARLASSKRSRLHHRPRPYDSKHVRAVMTSATSIPAEEYLHTTYRPNCDYVDGEVLERSMGEQSHARLQLLLASFFRFHRDTWRLRALAEQRVQVKATRFRIPDVCVVWRSDPNEEVLRTPPLLCIEVLSSDDSLRSLQERVQDYLEMGVTSIWAVDPWNRVAYYASTQGYLQPTDGYLRLPGTEAAVSLEELFHELDIA